MLEVNNNIKYKTKRTDVDFVEFFSITRRIGDSESKELATSVVLAYNQSPVLSD